MSKEDEGKSVGSVICPKCKNKTVKEFFNDTYSCQNCKHTWAKPKLKESKFEQYLEESCKDDYKFGKQEESNNKAYTKEELAKKLKVDPSEIKTNSVKGKTDLWIVKGVTYKKK